MKKMDKKGTEKIISVYWFAILFIVAAAVVYMVITFYGKPYDIRSEEADIMVNQIADCLAEGGRLKEEILDNENFTKNFSEECSLNFNVEDVYGWREQDQYYIEINFYEFDQNAPNGFGSKIDFDIIKGNTNLKALAFLEGMGRKKREIDTIIIHFTEGPTLGSAVQEFEATDKSIHYLINKNGDITFRVNENEVAIHSGSKYNKKSIGIELVNLGHMCGDEEKKNLCDFGGGETCKDICGDLGKGVEIGGIVWEKYPDEQIDALIHLVAGIVSRRDILIDRQHIIGHEEIIPKPKEKFDPGPAFPWDEFIQGVEQKVEQGVEEGEAYIGFIDPTLGRSFYVLDKQGNQYIIKISAIVGKIEKNVS